MAASAYHVISNHVIWKEVENRTFRHTIAVLEIHVCIHNPYWQSSGIIIFLCKYYIAISDTPIGCAFLVARCNIIRASWKTEKERSSYRKRYIEEFVYGTFFGYIPIFCGFFVYSLPFVYSKGQVKDQTKTKDHTSALHLRLRLSGEWKFDNLLRKPKTIQNGLKTLINSCEIAQISKGFADLMRKGNVSGALNLVKGDMVCVRVCVCVCVCVKGCSNLKRKRWLEPL